MTKKRENIKRIMISVNLICQTYEYMAKKLGIKDEMLSLLYALDDQKIYTQKTICKLWNIPKTTINAIIQESKERNLITLEENPLNRKEKNIRMTEYGKMFSEEILKPLYALEEMVYQNTDFNDEIVLKIDEFAQTLNDETNKYFDCLDAIAKKNQLKLIKGDECLKYYKDIEKLYYDAFPKNERIDFKYFKENIEGFDLYAFTHENQFAGFTLCSTQGQIVYLLYFAMTSKCRGKGFGSQALELIKKDKKGKTILLDIEVEEANSENSLQRIKRKKFYLRSGFLETTLRYRQKNNEFEILCFGPIVSEDEIFEYWEKMPYEILQQYRK